MAERRSLTPEQTNFLDNLGVVTADHIRARNLPPRILKRIEELGISGAEVARRVGIDPSIPHLWIRGKRLVPITQVFNLASALEYPIKELLRLDRPPQVAVTDPQLRRR